MNPVLMYHPFFGDLSVVCIVFLLAICVFRLALIGWKIWSEAKTVVDSTDPVRRMLDAHLAKIHIQREQVEKQNAATQKVLNDTRTTVVDWLIKQGIPGYYIQCGEKRIVVGLMRPHILFLWRDTRCGIICIDVHAPTEHESSCTKMFEECAAVADYYLRLTADERQVLYADFVARMEENVRQQKAGTLP